MLSTSVKTREIFNLDREPDEQRGVISRVAKRE